MGRSFTAAMTNEPDGVVTLTIGFGEPAANTQVVPDAIAALADLRLTGGRGIHFNGPASLPAAMALAHAVAHLYGYVACYDPKLKCYVVAISHDPGFRPGQLLPVAGAR
jgi:CRISPR-associated protein Csx3